MAVWSARLAGDGRSHTFLKRVFAALEGRQLNFDFLLLGVEACPREHKEFDCGGCAPCVRRARPTRRAGGCAGSLNGRAPHL